jgi:hypothetical protein
MNSAKYEPFRAGDVGAPMHSGFQPAHAFEAHSHLADAHIRAPIWVPKRAYEQRSPKRLIINQSEDQLGRYSRIWVLNAASTAVDRCSREHVAAIVQIDDLVSSVYRILFEIEGPGRARHALAACRRCREVTLPALFDEWSRAVRRS